MLAENDLPDAERRRFTANVQSQSERLQTLIDKLLRLAQLEQQRELDAPGTINMHELFADLEQTMSAQATKRGITVRFAAEPELQVTGDRFLLSLALNNLLQNALDFSPQEGTVTCTAETDGTNVVLRIQDQGHGIAEYACERIFERFFSLPRPDGAPKSTGLGLPLVHEIAVLHGGEIRLENSPEGGVVAILSIPHKIANKRENSQSQPKAGSTIA